MSVCDEHGRNSHRRRQRAGRVVPATPPGRALRTVGEQRTAMNPQTNPQEQEGHFTVARKVPSGGGGGGGNRPPALSHAREALSHLTYTPEGGASSPRRHGPRLPVQGQAHWIVGAS